MDYVLLTEMLVTLAVLTLASMTLLTVREIKRTMATKEDVEKLETALKGVQDAAELIATDTAALKEELKKANENSAVDLTGAIETASNIEARLKAIAGPNAGSDPEPEPEPIPEGGGAEV